LITLSRKHHRYQEHVAPTHTVRPASTHVYGKSYDSVKLNNSSSLRIDRPSGSSRNQNNTFRGGFSGSATPISAYMSSRNDQAVSTSDTCRRQPKQISTVLGSLNRDPGTVTRVTRHFKFEERHESSTLASSINGNLKYSPQLQMSL
jgi:hypothetical protein